MRKAIAYSIDKQNIISSIYNNKYYTSSFPLDYGNWLCEESDASSGYNVEQAKQLLTDNGWSYKNGFWQKLENYRTQKISLNLLLSKNSFPFKDKVTAILFFSIIILLFFKKALAIGCL